MRDSGGEQGVLSASWPRQTDGGVSLTVQLSAQHPGVCILLLKPVSLYYPCLDLLARGCLGKGSIGPHCHKPCSWM